MGPPGGDDKPLHLQLLALASFATFNIGLNEFNSWALRRDQWPNFHFAFFYTTFHMLTSMLAAYLLQACVIQPKLGPPTLSQLWDYKLAILPMGVCTFLTNGLNNASLTAVSLFLNQAIKACMPMPTLFFSFAFADKRYSCIKIVVVCTICLGSVLAVWYNIESDQSGSQISGAAMVVTGMLAASLRPVFAMLLMDGLGSGLPKLEPTVVMVYDCGIAFTCMLITWLCLNERAESIAYLSDPETTGVGVLIISVGCTMAFIFNLTSFYFIKLTSALTTTIGSSGVKILLIVVSAVQAGVDSIISWIGVGIVVVSLVSYAYINIPQSPPRPANPTGAADERGAPHDRLAPGVYDKTPPER